MHRDKSSAAKLLTARGLAALGPVLWGSPVSSDVPGVYVVEAQEFSDAAPIDSVAVAGWINRVPTLLVDGRRPTADELASRLASFWISGEPVLYVAGTSVAKRVRQFYRTPLGDPRPHAGGHWLKALATLAALHVWWAETDDPASAEDALLVAFADRVASKPGPRLFDPVLPFANRQTAAGIRKAHGITGSTLDRSPRRTGLVQPASTSVASTSATVGSGTRATGASLEEINRALQAFACSRPDGEATAVEAAEQLERLGLLSDSPSRRGKPLRDLLRAGRIDNARQESGRWWFISCASSNESRK